MCIFLKCLGTCFYLFSAEILFSRSEATYSLFISFHIHFQFLSNFALLLEEVGSQTVGPSNRYKYQQLTPQHGLKMYENSLHPTFQESLAVGLNFKICHLNIEGISAPKTKFLSRLMRKHEIDIVAIQETHTTSDVNLLNGGKLPADSN
jgi:hypothetical protein